MSIRLALTELVTVLDSRWGYLIIPTGPSMPAKVVALGVVVDGAVMRFDAGSGSLFSAAARGGAATFVVPPTGVGELGGYSLVIDGAVRVEGEQVIVEPTNAVWHRPALGLST